MMEYVLDYLVGKGVTAVNKAEQEKLEKGIRLFLQEKGIKEGDNEPYYKRYVASALSMVGTADLKMYLIEYPVISAIMQIVFEWKADGKIPSSRKEDLRSCMKELYESGLGDRYIPATEVQMILA